MRVAVFGLGYVGAVSALCMARNGHEVIGCDVDVEKLDRLRRGRSPVQEPGLDELAAAAREGGRLQLTSLATEACDRSDIGVVCVGTPTQADGTPNLAALRRVSGDVGRALAADPRRYLLVVRSTVLAGTTEAVAAAVRTAVGPSAAKHFRIAFVPEFLREGSALQDYDNPPLAVFGVEDTGSAELLAELYARPGHPVRSTTLRVAELVKYAGNAFHATKVAFANEIGRLAAAVGADAAEVMELFALDRALNVGPAYLRPGFAFGGPCLPKDLTALRSAAAGLGVSVPLLDGVAASNERLLELAVARIRALRPQRVALFGVGFKPGTGDMRGSPQLELATRLVDAGIDVVLHDPDIIPEQLIGENRRAAQQLPGFSGRLMASADAAIAGSDVIIIGQRRPEFQAALRDAASGQTIVDLADCAFAGREAPLPHSGVGALRTSTLS